MERAQIHEQVAWAETLTFAPGGIYSASCAQHCSQATWQAPQRIKETLQAEGVYLHGPQPFAEQLEWVKTGLSS